MIRKLRPWVKFALLILLFCLLIFFLVRPLVSANVHNTPPNRAATPTPYPLTDWIGALSSNQNLTAAVDTFTGSGAQQALPSAYSGGETFPGADMPFGMVQWSPDTFKRAYSGYSYYDNQIKGFSLTHLSGAGCSQYGDVPFMPFIGAFTDSPAVDPTRYLSTFSRSNEVAHPGYYGVKLDSGVTTELTVTQRSGAGRFAYPAGQPAGMLINLAGSLNAVTDAQATLGSNTISGWVKSGNFCYIRENTYRVYFWAQFSQPFTTTGIWQNGKVTRDATTVAGPASGVFVNFATSKQTVLNVRVGISYVSVANARANVEQENPTGNFDALHQQATQTWNQWLGRIQISGGTASQQATFYTALYHALLFPSVFSDANGQYPGFDGQTHRVPAGHAQYSNFSGWDIYRSEAQLLALLAPDQAADMAQSLVNDYAQSGGLPKWALANGETYVQTGDPASAIIADIYAFGGTQFDTQAALAAMIHQAMQPNSERPGLSYLEQVGYVPMDIKAGCCNFYGAASTTLEYNVADFALGAFAGALGDSADQQKFEQRAQDWRNLFNPATGYLEPRTLKGAFLAHFGLTDNHYWVEGNKAQYTWMVPFNLRGLFAAMGGNARAVQRLDTFFTQLDAGLKAPYAFLGNEPTLETPWEYDYAGAPYKTQKIVREAVNTLYGPGPEGLPGNEDLGQMSSWYIFAAMGMYPETPGTATLVLASPLFPRITLHRPGGQVIQINAPGASASVYYVQNLKVNGQVSTKPWLPPSFIAHGGTLDYTLTSTPDTSWGSSPADAPPSYQ